MEEVEEGGQEEGGQELSPGPELDMMSEGNGGQLKSEAMGFLLLSKSLFLVGVDS